MLLDVENFTLRNTQKMRWNVEDKWVLSEKAAHPPIISKEQSELAQATLVGRGRETRHKHHRRTRVYALHGVRAHHPAMTIRSTGSGQTV